MKKVLSSVSKCAIVFKLRQILNSEKKVSLLNDHEEWRSTAEMSKPGHATISGHHMTPVLILPDSYSTLYINLANTNRCRSP